MNADQIRAAADLLSLSLLSREAGRYHVYLSQVNTGRIAAVPQDVSGSITASLGRRGLVAVPACLADACRGRGVAPAPVLAALLQHAPLLLEESAKGAGSGVLADLVRPPR